MERLPVLWPHVNTVWADDASMAISFLARIGKMTGDEKSQQQSDAKVKITGQVFDESGEGIPGANVTLKSNPTSGTVTDLDGKFILMASPQKDVLVVSFIGYNTQEFPLKGKTKRYHPTLTKRK